MIDHQFNTTDVCVVVKTDLVTDKYYRHYERQARDGGSERMSGHAAPARPGLLYVALTLPLMPLQAAAGG